MTNFDTHDELRPLCTIAREVLDSDTLGASTRHYARDALEGMLHLSTVHENYYSDSGRSVVAYALSNLKTWRGPDARRIKAELKQHLDN